MLGLVAGFRGGIVDTSIMRLMDVMLALPSLLLAIAVVAILGPGLVNAMYRDRDRAAAALRAADPRRRGDRRARASEYVTSSRIAGAGTLRLMFSTVLPNCTAPLIVQATLGFSTRDPGCGRARLPRPRRAAADAGMGHRCSPARCEFIQRAWWVVTFPGLAILVTVLAFNLIGDGLRDALDPKLKR